MNETGGESVKGLEIYQILPENNFKVRTNFSPQEWFKVVQKYAEENFSPDLEKQIRGRTIGLFIEDPANPNSKLREIKSTLYAGYFPRDVSSPEEKVPHFNIRTYLELNKTNPFLSNEQITALMSELKRDANIEVTLNTLPNGNRVITIIKEGKSFSLFAGWPDKNSYLKGLKKTFSGIDSGSYDDKRKEYFEGNYRGNVSFEISNAGRLSSGTPLEENNFEGYLKTYMSLLGTVVSAIRRNDPSLMRRRIQLLEKKLEEEFILSPYGLPTTPPTRESVKPQA